MSKPRSALRQFLASSRQPQNAILRPPRRQRFRGFLPIWERMEERTLLATMIWANPLGGVWDVASNWVNQANPANQHVPTASDDAEIDDTGITVTFSSGDDDSVYNLCSQATLDLSSGTLSVTGTIQSSGGQLTLEGATLAGAIIAAGTTLVGQSGTLDGVTIDGNLQVTGDNSLTVQNGLTVGGTVTLGDASSIGYLIFNGNQTLGGTGTVAFSGASYTPYYAYYNGLFVASANLTIGPGVTVDGQLGIIGYSSPYQGSPGCTVINQGTIQADVSGGSITIDGTGDQNAGSINAVNGATLALETTLSNTGTVSVDDLSSLSGGGTLSGGTLATQTGASIANVTLDGVTVDGNWQVTGDQSATVEDGMTLNGTLSLGDASSIGYLNFRGSQTLGGTGTVAFSSASIAQYYPAYNGLFVAISGTTLTIGPGVTVDGQLGIIGYSSPYQGSPVCSVVNQGTIQADESGTTITIDGTGDQNTGTLNALNGATLLLQGSDWLDSGVNYLDATSTFSLGASFSNSGNTLALTGPGTFTLSGTIQGGTINVPVGTTFDPSGTLDGVTVDGNWQVTGTQSVTVEDGLILDGTLSLGDASSIGYLTFSGNQTLGGTGTVAFSGASYTPYYAYYNGLFVASANLTIGPGVTVDGQLGIIGYSSPYQGSPGCTVINQGTIQADVSGGSITIDGTGDQNAGSINAVNGATLALETTLSNTGTVSVDDLSSLSGGGTLSGGTLATQTGASIANVTLDGVTVDGNWQVTGDQYATVEDGMTLDGTLSLGDASSIGYLNFRGSQTLGGTGTVAFSSASIAQYYPAYNGLFVSISGTTLTIGPGVTVDGQLGIIGYSSPYQGSPVCSVVNQGTIQADESGTTITIDGTGDQNTGTLNALNGATLLLQGSDWLDSGVNYLDATSTFSLGASFSNSGNTLALTGPGTFTLSGTIQGGTINVPVGTTFDPSGTLDGVTVDGNWQVTGTQSVTVEDGLTLDGTLSLGDASSIGYLIFNGNQTLGGTGTVAFSGASYTPYYAYYNGLFVASANLTIGPGVTVDGQLGIIGYSSPYQGSAGCTVINQGTIQADSSGGSITIDGTGDQNAGCLSALNGATLSLESTLSNTGTVSVDATSSLSGGGTLSGGTLATQTGASIASVTLDGVTVDGNWQVNGDQYATVEDGLTLDGTLSLGDASSIGYLNFRGSQTLGGTGTVAFSQRLGRLLHHRLQRPVRRDFRDHAHHRPGRDRRWPTGDHRLFVPLSGFARLQRCQPGDNPGRRERHDHHDRRHR